MAKQVFRSRDAAGRFAGDHVTRADEPAEGEPLLVSVVREGNWSRLSPDSTRSGRIVAPSSIPYPIGSFGTEAEPDYSISSTATPLRPRLIAWGSTEMHPIKFLHDLGRPCHRRCASCLGAAGIILTGMRMSEVASTPERFV